MTYDKSFGDKNNDLFGSESYIVGKRVQRFFYALSIEIYSYFQT